MKPHPGSDFLSLVDTMFSLPTSHFPSLPVVSVTPPM